MPSTNFSIADAAVRLTILTLALVAAACSPSDGRTQAAPRRDSTSAEQASDTTVIEIRGPTLLAHFPVTQAEVDSNPDVGEALSDFQYHLDRVRDDLARLGIVVEERYAATVRYRLAGQLVRFAPPADSGVAYVFLAPDRPARTSYGVVTDVELLELAQSFLPIRPDP